MDAGVDAIDIDEDDVDVDVFDTEYNDDGAGISNIASDYSENKYSLTGEDSDKLAVRTTCTAGKKDESAEEFLLIRGSGFPLSSRLYS